MVEVCRCMLVGGGQGSEEGDRQGRKLHVGDMVIDLKGGEVLIDRANGFGFLVFLSNQCSLLSSMQICCGLFRLRRRFAAGFLGS